MTIVELGGCVNTESKKARLERHKTRSPPTDWPIDGRRALQIRQRTCGGARLHLFNFAAGE
jgi:hypothetical protein